MTNRQPLKCVRSEDKRSEDKQLYLQWLLDSLNAWHQELLRCEPQRRAEFKPRPPRIPAVYLLSEGNCHLYVGRTRNLRKRLADHMRPGSRKGSATFAYKLAKEKAAANDGRDIDALFREQKERVRQMNVRYVALADPAAQALLEVYVAETLATPHNSFETH